MVMRITQEELRARYGEMPQQVNDAVQRALDALPDPQRSVSRRIVLRTAALAFALMLLGGMALATGGWMGIAQWLDGSQEVTPVQAERLLAETDEVTCILRETALYGDVLIVAIQVSPKKPGQKVLAPMMGAIPRVSAKGTLDRLLLQQLNMRGIPRDKSQMRVDEYLKELGVEGIWADVSLHWRRETTDMMRTVAGRFFYVHQEDGSVMVFSTFSGVDQSQKSLTATMMYRSATADEMSAFTGSELENGAAPAYKEVKVTLDIPAASMPEQRFVAGEVVCDLGAYGTMTVSDVRAIPMPMGAQLTYQLHYEGPYENPFGKVTVSVNGLNEDLYSMYGWQLGGQPKVCCGDMLVYTEGGGLPKEMVVNVDIPGHKRTSVTIRLDE